jgi:ABC-type Mn2+/Zn2+ transport system permease subunit
MVVSVALGWFAVVVGLFFSYHYALAAGAAMAGVSVAMFFTVLSIQALWEWLRPAPVMGDSRL